MHIFDKLSIPGMNLLITEIDSRSRRAIRDLPSELLFSKNDIYISLSKSRQVTRVSYVATSQFKIYIDQDREIKVELKKDRWNSESESELTLVSLSRIMKGEISAAEALTDPSLAVRVFYEFWNKTI